MRLLAGAATVALLAGISTSLAPAVAASVSATTSAAAQPIFADAPRLSWRYTVSRDPEASRPAVADVPLGAWRDAAGKHTMSRSYVQYDLTGFAGKSIVQARLFFREAQATDCQRRLIDVWQTADTPAKPTWRKPRMELQKLATVGATTFCPAEILRADLTEAIRAAVRAGKPKISLEVRLPDSIEGDLALGRWIDNPSGFVLSVGYNTPPVVVAEHLYNNYQTCDRTAPYQFLQGEQPSLHAMLRDEDQGIDLAGEFAIWPVTDPTQRTELTRSNAASGFVAQVQLPAGTVASGGTYAWQARATDGIDTTEWTEPCYFTSDFVRPDSAPGVSSTTWPEDAHVAGGTPGAFTFTSSGVADVYAYEYVWRSDFSVHGCSIREFGIPDCGDRFGGDNIVFADGLGGPGTVALVPPDDGPQQLRVRSLDRAGNASPIRNYEFFITDTQPSVTLAGPEPVIGQPVTLRLAPHPDVTSVLRYTYRVNNGPEQTVTAAADGTAELTVTLSASGYNAVAVRSHSSNGWISTTGGYEVYFDTTPQVSSEVYPEDVAGGGVGVPGTFTFTPAMPGVTEYWYDFDFSNPQRVDADAAGRASVTWTPEVSGFHILTVTARTAAGADSLTRYYFFEVISSMVTVEGEHFGKVGVAAQFRFTATQPQPVEFVYSFHQSDSGWSEERSSVQSVHTLWTN